MSVTLETPLDRVDGPLKVTGRARYASDQPFAGLVHAVLIQSTIARGRIATMETASAESAPGVLAVLTHRNAPKLHQPPPGGLGPTPPLQLQDDRILYNGQHIGVIVAETFEQALYAASLVRVTYAEEPAHTSLDEAMAGGAEAIEKATPDRGAPQVALAAAAVRVDETYTTPDETNNPLGPFATVAQWSGDNLTVYDTTQWVQNVRDALAAAFKLPQENVRVEAPFVGGAFGAGLRVWPHVPLAALAARVVGRPVKLVLTRAQMFTSIGYRPQTVQHVALGATGDGHLSAIVHEVTSPNAQYYDYESEGESLTHASRILYTCPHVHTNYRRIRLDVLSPTSMRAPGDVTGQFALESAMDELAVALGVDPIALRLRNLAASDQEKGLPWSSNSLRECFAQGAARFGWERRTPAPRSMRDGRMLVGMGMAAATYPTRRGKAGATVRVLADGTAIVRSSATDIGPGTYTALTTVAAATLGLDPKQVRVELADSTLPQAPAQGGSQTMATVGSVVQMAAQAARDELLAHTLDDPQSPLRDYTPEQISAADGRFFATHAPSVGETYADILERQNLPMIEVQRESGPGDEAKQYSMNAFGAQFAEVQIDPDLGEIRVMRLVAALGVGRIISPKTARSQIIGGIVGGVGMALLERTIRDHPSGRVANANLADYLIPVNADIREVETLFVEEDDPHVNPLGAKGVGEIGIVGTAAAIANAVYHATGVRVRDLPILPEKVLR